jgi:hypothetical protein
MATKLNSFPQINEESEGEQ